MINGAVGADHRGRYKGYGQAFTDKAGTRDRNEFYNVPAHILSHQFDLLIVT